MSNNHVPTWIASVYMVHVIMFPHGGHVIMFPQGCRHFKSGTIFTKYEIHFGRYQDIGLLGYLFWIRSRGQDATYSLRCIVAVCPTNTLLSMSTWLCALQLIAELVWENIDSILVLISTIVRPPSANVLKCDSLFKASGKVFQRNGNANLFKLSTMFGNDGRLPMHKNGAAQHCLQDNTFTPNDNSLLS